MSQSSAEKETTKWALGKTHQMEMVLSRTIFVLKRALLVPGNLSRVHKCFCLVVWCGYSGRLYPVWLRKVGRWAHFNSTALSQDIKAALALTKVKNLLTQEALLLKPFGSHSQSQETSRMKTFLYKHIYLTGCLQESQANLKECKKKKKKRVHKNKIKNVILKIGVMQQNEPKQVLAYLSPRTGAQNPRPWASGFCRKIYFRKAKGFRAIC